MFVVNSQFTEDYLKLLKKFANFLKQRAASLPISRSRQFDSFISQLESSVSLALKMKSRKKPINQTISINPNIIFSYKNPEDKHRKYHVTIGGEINIVDSVISDQSLCINLLLEHTERCSKITDRYKFYDIDRGFHVLRRFHFDYDGSNDDYAKPRFHLQYGGKFQESYLRLEKLHYKLFKPIDYPRLPQQPHDLIILLDFLFREFDLAGKEITGEKKWIECVIDSEKLWLSPYYEELINRLNSSIRKSPLHRVTRYS